MIDLFSQHTKAVGHSILINEATRQALGGDILVEDCGPIEIRGKMQTANVFIVPAGQTILR
jgi:class 3 adenylate cyclase